MNNRNTPGRLVAKGSAKTLSDILKLVPVKPQDMSVVEFELRSVNKIRKIKKVEFYQVGYMLTLTAEWFHPSDERAIKMIEMMKLKKKRRRR